MSRKKKRERETVRNAKPRPSPDAWRSVFAGRVRLLCRGCGRTAGVSASQWELACAGGRRMHCYTCGGNLFPLGAR